LLGADPRPPVDRSEVLRLGDTVQRLGDGIRAGETELFAAAMAPPASDADKWFISFVTTKGCVPCDQLKQEWTTNPWLLALANPADPKQSWAHFTVYDKDDRSQTFRFENIKINAYPTILVQPPRSRRYGEPSTVVYQGTYQGDPERLAREITTAIRQYLDKLQLRGGPVDPPWPPAPKVQPTPAPQFPTFDPTIPPPPPTPVAPTTTLPWSAILTIVTAGFTLPAGAAVTYWLITLVRSYRQASGKPPLVDQAVLAAILEELKKVAEIKASTSGR
jgi:hypothetical protein